MPIMAIYFLTFEDTNIKLIGAIIATVQISHFILEIPSGYLSDRLGHKKTLVITRIFFLISTICFLIGGLYLFFIGALFFGFGLAFVSGTLTAFMQETLQALNKETQYSKIIGKSQSIFLIVNAILITGIPITYSINTQLPFIIALVLDIIGLLIAISFTDPSKFIGNKKEEIKSKSFKEILKEARNINIIPITIISSLIYGIVLGAKSFQDVYQSFIGINIIYFGLIFAAGKILSAIIMRSPLHKLKDKLSFNQFILFSVILLWIFMLPLGLTQNIYLIILSFIISSGFMWGINPILSHYKLDRIGTSNYKASLLSLGGLSDSMILAITSFSLGLLISQSGYSFGYLQYIIVTAIIFSLTFIIFRSKDNK